MTNTREQIFGTISRCPGIHFNELVRRLELAPGQVQYHVKRLVREDRIVREACFGRTHHFPCGVDGADRQVIALLRRETPRAIVTKVLEVDSIERRALAADLDLAESTVSYHLDRLEEAGVIDIDYVPGSPARIRVVDPVSVIPLLSLTSRELPATLTDRLERLIDDLLEE